MSCVRLHGFHGDERVEIQLDPAEGTVRVGDGTRDSRVYGVGEVTAWLDSGDVLVVEIRRSGEEASVRYSLPVRNQLPWATEFVDSVRGAGGRAEPPDRTERPEQAESAALIVSEGGTRAVRSAATPNGSVPPPVAASLPAVKGALAVEPSKRARRLKLALPTRWRDRGAEADGAPEATARDGTAPEEAADGAPGAEAADGAPGAGVFAQGAEVPAADGAEEPPAATFRRPAISLSFPEQDPGWIVARPVASAAEMLGHTTPEPEEH